MLLTFKLTLERTACTSHQVCREVGISGIGHNFVQQRQSLLMLP